MKVDIKYIKIMYIYQDVYCKVRIKKKIDVVFGYGIMDNIVYMVF